MSDFEKLEAELIAANPDMEQMLIDSKRELQERIAQGLPIVEIALMSPVSILNAVKQEGWDG